MLPIMILTILAGPPIKSRARTKALVAARRLPMRPVRLQSRPRIFDATGDMHAESH